MYFPDDPLIPLRPDLQVDPRRARAPAAGVALRSRADRARVGARATASTSSCAAAHATPFEERHMTGDDSELDRHRVADRRPVLPFRPGHRQRARAPWPTEPSEASASPALPGHRRRRPTCARRAGRNLAGRCGRQRCRAPSSAPTPAFRGFGRLPTGEDGTCEFETVRPGRVRDGRGGLQAPHINVCLFARGLLRQLHTRIYFAGDPAHRATMPCSRWCRRIGDARCWPRADPRQPDAGVFDMRLQGDDETVFFDV